MVRMKSANSQKVVKTMPGTLLAAATIVSVTIVTAAALSFTQFALTGNISFVGVDCLSLLPPAEGKLCDGKGLLGSFPS